MNIASELRALEEKLLQPDFRRNRSVVAALLADDFREFGSSGRAWTKQQILNHLETEVHFEAAMCDFDAIELAAGAVLVTYRITTLRSGEKAAQSLRSSIWIKRDDHWQMLFHQGTPITLGWSDYLKSSPAASPEFMQDAEDLSPK